MGTRTEKVNNVIHTRKDVSEAYSMNRAFGQIPSLDNKVKGR